MNKPSSAIALALAALFIDPASAAEFVPGGEAGRKRLLGFGGPSEADVRAEYARQGFSTLPVGAGSCARCHPDVADAWNASAHRFSSFSNPYYTAAAKQFHGVRGAGGFVFCAECHDPALAITGPVHDDDLGAPRFQAGIGCLTCHSMHATPPPTGNARYRLDLEPVPIGEGHAARVALDGADGARCGTCHRVSIAGDLSDGRWRRGQDDHFGWRDGPYAEGGSAVILARPDRASCVDCHMPRVAASAQEKGAKQGRIRDHRALGAATALAHLRDDAETRAALDRFLQQTLTVELAQVRPGEVDVVLLNHAGHPFPAGVNDTNQAWVEVIARDVDGAVVASSGVLDPDRRVPAEAHLIRSQAVTDEADPLPRRAAHLQREPAYDTRLPVLQPRVLRYRLPANAAQVAVRVLYRQFGPDYTAFACAELPDGPARARCLTAPVTEMNRVDAKLVAGALPTSSDPDRLLRHGLGLATGLAGHAREAETVLDRADRLRPNDPRILLARACVDIALGRTDAALALLDRVDALPDAPPARHRMRAEALARAYRTGPARAAADALMAAVPGERAVLALAAKLRNADGDPTAALAAADALLAIDPESPAGWYQRRLAALALGMESAARDATILWKRRRVVDEDIARLRKAFRARHPERAAQLQPIPTRDLSAAP